MFGLGKKKSVAEYEADGDVERAYYEIKQVLRVTGINLNFRSLAVHSNSFPFIWDALRPNAETRAFEEAADQIRSEAANSVTTLGQLHAASTLSLGESQLYQIRAALDLYHYINPKLLVLMSAVGLCLGGASVGGQGSEPIASEWIERGPPSRMYPMEMEHEEPEDKMLKDLFEDIKTTLSLSSINSDYRTLALWPDYLSLAWERLKPVTQRRDFKLACDRLRDSARSLAQALPYSVPLTTQNLDELGDDAGAVKEMIQRFEQLLPGLILNIALLEHDWQSGEDLARSPFPAGTRQMRQGGVA